MKNLKIAALLTILGAGMAYAQPQNPRMEDLPAAPRLEHSSPGSIRSIDPASGSAFASLWKIRD